MKRTKPKGRLLMTLGLLCILCAGVMAGQILLTERRSDQAAQTVLSALNQQIPHNTPNPTAETLQLVITDQHGIQVDWPMAEQDVPMPWPVDESGVPVSTLTDAFGEVFIWQYDVNRPCIVTPVQEEVIATANASTGATMSPVPHAADSPTATTEATVFPAPHAADSPTATTEATVSPVPHAADSTTASTEATVSPVPHAADSPTVSTEATVYPAPHAADSPTASTGATMSPVPHAANSTTATAEGTISPVPHAADSTTASAGATVSPAPTGTPFPSLPQTDDTRPASTAAPTSTASVTASTWTQDEQGSLLPYVSDGQGQIIPWLTDAAGHAVARELLLRLWKTLVAQLAVNWTELLSQPTFVLNPNMEMPVTTLDGHEYIGILDIPSQGLSLPIMSEWSYPKLKIAPCRYSGSAYSGDLIIAGHNSNGHFTPIKKLVNGDEVRFTDVDGNVFIYTVIGVDVVDANDVPSMLAGADEWDLSLFTCSHNSRKRTTIRCKLETYLLPDAEQ